MCIVVPCYNEELNLDQDAYSRFLVDTPDALVCFVDDGSTDRTAGILSEIERDNRVNVKVISLERNVGKAEAVRQGILYCDTHYNHTVIGFLDADLSTSLQEFKCIAERLRGTTTFVFGSRIRILGSQIDRTPFRFYTGRVIATIISNVLNLKVYDTQCGCKLFTKELSLKLFKDAFVSKWLFDVELFFRMMGIYGYLGAISKMEEVPLKKWINAGNSKVKITYFFKLWIDLIQIKRQYRYVRNQHVTKSDEI